VFEGIESSDGCDVSNVRYLDHRVLLTEVADVLVGGERREGVCT
jgi:hypothetical protein